MERMFYCSTCESMRCTRIIEKEQTLYVKGKSITLTAPVRICEVCGEEILDEELDDATLARFYDEYHKLENLLLPSKNKSNSSDQGDEK